MLNMLFQQLEKQNNINICSNSCSDPEERARAPTQPMQRARRACVRACVRFSLQRQYNERGRSHDDM